MNSNNDTPMSSNACGTHAYIIANDNLTSFIHMQGSMEVTADRIDTITRREVEVGAYGYVAISAYMYLSWNNGITAYVYSPASE